MKKTAKPNVEELESTDNAQQPATVDNPPPKPERVNADVEKDDKTAKKRGRKPKKTVTADAINRNAAAMVDGGITGAAALLGDHWNADKDERDKLAESVANYYHAKGEVPDLSPGLVLTFAIASYTIPRAIKTFQEPPVKSKAVSLYNWFLGIKARRDAKKKETADKKATAATVEKTVKYGND